VSRKAELVAKLGVDYLYVMEFSKLFSRLLPQEFVDQYMVQMKAKYVVAGFDYTYGKRDIANMENLPKYAKGRFEVVTIPEQMYDGKKIGSSSIKELIANNQVDLAN